MALPEPTGGRPVGGVPDGEVEGFGEGDGGQAHLDGPLTGAQQRGPWAGVPRELRVHVVVRRQHRCPSNRSSTASAHRVPVVGAAAYGRVMSTAVQTDLTDEALGVLRELTGRPDALF